MRRANDGLSALEHATERLLDTVAGLDEGTIRGASALPGWSRGHVIAHLARNADALLNLLTWARTGVEHPMYASRADRDADIDEGARRSGRLLREDLIAACERFSAAARSLPPSGWRAEVVVGDGWPLTGHEIPWLRVREVWIHLADLRCGFDLVDLPEEVQEELIDDAVAHYDGMAGVPSFTLRADLADGSQREWIVNGTNDSSVGAVRGDAITVLAWLTGRGDASALSGDAPRLPDWI
ncbi:maleylpyruvate isomerase family mycothiol-dependent enzyme [Allokutzneria sp. A3M-2-11 16]|uniref:maleylpyruvate isomerase family mycothiol-dependent enzyme n=1 Tax=Allokutzneria sp. A3M-2-11 16 TaxID=2962043 RepID=UPI0020B7E5B2|nr:maleylpyruvate isomerase family mycothiol-dependent enzyme [Allokutzneria sp. A3M-2-11 16]MCP3804257.1 maleylpyruvate isomerase family mycothiol-dependent enzyme [Allokutzneria sp. A3M-2-11 16]